MKLKEKVYSNLEGKRSLLALYDVWDPNLLQNIKFLSSNEAIKVLITTRGEGVVLSSDESFKLFCIHAIP